MSNNVQNNTDDVPSLNVLNSINLKKAGSQEDILGITLQKVTVFLRVRVGCKPRPSEANGDLGETYPMFLCSSSGRSTGDIMIMMVTVFLPGFMVLVLIFQDLHISFR